MFEKEEVLKGKKIKDIEITGAGITLITEDNIELNYSASDGGYSDWAITMDIKIGDIVETKNYIGEIININDFREPSMRYGLEVSGLKDVVFIGDNDIMAVLEHKN